MSIRRVTCPGCGAAANVPAAMANVKCPACGTVWNVNNPAAAAKKAAPQATEKSAPKKKSTDESTANAAMIAGLLGGAILFLVMVGMAVMVLNREGTPKETAASEVVEDTIKPATPQEYRVINKDEATRKQIYKDYRTVARTTVEKPLVLPQGSKPRQTMEDMLQKTFDNSLRQTAAQFDITVEDVHEVIKEGDAKVWDDSPRSNAVRGGKRVYPKEMSEGWKKNPFRK